MAEVARGDEVLSAALETTPDVAVLDIELPGTDGLQAAERLRERLPACRVVMLTTFGRPGYLRRAMAAGARGFLLKESPAGALAAAIRRVMAGDVVVEPDLALSALRAGESPLSARERDVLDAARSGQTIASLAVELHLSEGTVRNHLSAAIQKLGSRTRAGVARIAADRGWL